MGHRVSPRSMRCQHFQTQLTDRVAGNVGVVPAGGRPAPEWRALDAARPRALESPDNGVNPEVRARKRSRFGRRRLWVWANPLTRPPGADILCLLLKVSGGRCS